jgi:hypothetical protein
MQDKITAEGCENLTLHIVHEYEPQVQVERLDPVQGKPARPMALEHVSHLDAQQVVTIVAWPMEGQVGLWFCFEKAPRFVSPARNLNKTQHVRTRSRSGQISSNENRAYLIIGEFLLGEKQWVR